MDKFHIGEVLLILILGADIANFEKGISSVFKCKSVFVSIYFISRRIYISHRLDGNHNGRYEENRNV